MDIVECELCSSDFEDKHALNTHISMVHGKPKVECEICQDTFQVQPDRVDSAKYCSNECQYKSLQVDRIEVSCSNCGEGMDRREKDIENSKHLFCNIDCRKSFYTGENHPRWSGGYYNKSLGNYGPNWDDYRQKIIERDQICKRCNTEPEIKQVHHIRPVESFVQSGQAVEESHTLDNLVLLCPSCHMIVENNWTENKQKRLLL